VFLEAITEALEFLQLLFGFAQCRLCYRQNAPASGFTFAAEVQYSLDFLEGKSERLRLLDKTQLLHCGLIIDAVARSGSSRLP